MRNSNVNCKAAERKLTENDGRKGRVLKVGEEKGNQST